MYLNCMRLRDILFKRVNVLLFLFIALLNTVTFSLYNIFISSRPTLFFYCLSLVCPLSPYLSLLFFFFFSEFSGLITDFSSEHLVMTF